MHRPDERFTMCSTFKGLLAAQILLKIERGQEQFSRLIHYTARDLKDAGHPNFACPVTAANVQRGALTVEALCQAMVEMSDNLAAILLMRSIGGPSSLTAFVRSLGDTVTRSDRYEPFSNTYDGLLDTTTPRAIAKTAGTILLGPTLQQETRDLLTRWMINTKPGLQRLRASFPGDWVSADRPGTSGPDETNDYAVVWPPGRKAILMAAYYHAPHMSMDGREAVLRHVGSVIKDWVES